MIRPSIFFYVALALMQISASAECATILRTVNFTTGTLSNIDGGILRTAPPVTGSISTIFDNSKRFSTTSAIINRLSLPFSTVSVFSNDSIGRIDIYGLISGTEINRREFDFRIVFFATNSSFQYFDPVRGFLFEDFGFSNQIIDKSIVPEPVTWVLFLVGFAFIGLVMRRRQRKRLMINFISKTAR